MSQELNTGGPAFPMPGMAGLPNDSFIYGEHGMTLRDYFAAKALLAGPSGDKAPAYDDATRAKRAYELADAMLKARDS